MIVEKTVFVLQKGSVIYKFEPLQDPTQFSPDEVMITQKTSRSEKAWIVEIETGRKYYAQLLSQGFDSLCPE